MVFQGCADKLSLIEAEIADSRLPLPDGFSYKAAERQYAGWRDECPSTSTPIEN
jgi:hypothetical protein